MFEIQVEGVDRVIATFEKAVTPAQRQLMMMTLGRKVEQQTKTRFANKTDPDGKAWAALAATTVAMKGNSNILIQSGALSGSITSNASAAQAEIGSSVFYGKFHQKGAFNTWSQKPLPTRRFLGISDGNAAELEKIVLGFVAKQFGGN